MLCGRSGYETSIFVVFFFLIVIDSSAWISIVKTHCTESVMILFYCVSGRSVFLEVFLTIITSMGMGTGSLALYLSLSSFTMNTTTMINMDITRSQMFVEVIWTKFSSRVWAEEAETQFRSLSTIKLYLVWCHNCMAYESHISEKFPSVIWHISIQYHFTTNSYCFLNSYASTHGHKCHCLLSHKSKGHCFGATSVDGFHNVAEDKK